MSNETILVMIPLEIPVGQFQAFTDRMTGNDDDIVLLAEQAMRARMPEIPFPNPELELGMPGVAVPCGDRTFALDSMTREAAVRQRVG